MMLKIKNLSKSFGDKPVLRDFSAEFADGQIHGIMGSSGCGKTTLLRILLGLEKADSGAIEGLPAQISAVFQEDRLCDPFSAIANIEMVTANRVDRDTIRAHLVQLGLGESMTQPVSSLSGGMRRRVSIARAMLYDAPLYILDEPFKGLDEATRRQVMDYVRECTAGKTVLFVTHDADEAEYLADTVLKF